MAQSTGMYLNSCVMCLYVCFVVVFFIAKQYYYVLIPHFSPLLLFPGPVSFIRKSTFSRKWHYRHKWTAIDIRLHMCFSVDKSWLPTKWACDCFLYYEQRLTSIQTVKLLCLDLWVLCSHWARALHSVAICMY